ncbi:MAG: glycosyltransferase [Bacteroidetes bacterium]|nr:glycosyltransferase [Bacteroidota bacterium]MBU1718257.1 glycosyltransferase [Bacteroidota bacterium]
MSKNIFRKSKKILICPLDWGIGHATRCTPIIKILIELGAEPVICTSGLAAEFLRLEFPDIQHIVISGYNIKYQQSGSLASKLIAQSPRLVRAIKQEGREIREIIRDIEPLALISDNRLGLGTGLVYSVYMTHQLNIQPPSGIAVGGWVASALHRRYMQNYDEVWIPDETYPEGLSGDLSWPVPDGLKVSYTGVLSRFLHQKVIVPPGFDVLVLLSGPEPQRSILERMLIDQGAKSDLKIMIVRGKPGETDLPDVAENISIVNHIPSGKLENIIAAAPIVISRSGYSTVMDMAVMGKRAFFIPTPGQTEQEYLAKFLEQKGFASYSSQKNFDLKIAIETCKGNRNCAFPVLENDGFRLQSLLQNLIDR